MTVSWFTCRNTVRKTASQRRQLPLSVVFVSLPSAHPPLSPHSLQQFCSASPDLRVWLPGNQQQQQQATWVVKPARRRDVTSEFILLSSRSAPRPWLPVPPSPAWTSDHLLPCLNLLGKGEKNILKLLGNEVDRSEVCTLACVGSYFEVLWCLDRCRFQECPRPGWSRSLRRSSESSAPTEPSVSSPVDESAADYCQSRRYFFRSGWL